MPSSELIRGNHVRGCRGTVFGQSHSDAAKRIADEFNMHREADPYGNLGKWLAFALADGSSDHQVYDSKRDAVRHQHHNETRYMFVQVVPRTMWDCDAEALLNVHRRMYNSGVRLVDPDHRAGGPEMIRRATREDMKAQLRVIRSRGRSAPSNLQY